MIAFHNDPALKAAKLAQVRAHEAADEITKGIYWEGGKGCAVGCTVHSSSHAAYETEMGIPRMLARLEDRIFEGMPNDKAKLFPVRFIEAIPVGADLSLVGWKFLHWLIVDVTEKFGTELTRKGVAPAIEILRQKAAGEPVSKDAAWAADAAARAAAWAADAADAAARAAARAARAAARAAAAWAADAAAWAADAAAWAADAAARAADAAWAAKSASFDRQAEKLLELLAQAS